MEVTCIAPANRGKHLIGELEVKQIMLRAWELAKQGQKTNGGNILEYLSESLKISWTEYKAGKSINRVTVMDKEGFLTYEEFMGKARPGEALNYKAKKIVIPATKNSKKLTYFEPQGPKLLHPKPNPFKRSGRGLASVKELEKALLAKKITLRKPAELKGNLKTAYDNVAFLIKNHE